MLSRLKSARALLLFIFLLKVILLLKLIAGWIYRTISRTLSQEKLYNTHIVGMCSFRSRTNPDCELASAHVDAGEVDIWLSNRHTVNARTDSQKVPIEQEINQSDDNVSRNHFQVYVTLLVVWDSQTVKNQRFQFRNSINYCNIDHLDWCF